MPHTPGDVDEEERRGLGLAVGTIPLPQVGVRGTTDLVHPVCTQYATHAYREVRLWTNLGMPIRVPTVGPEVRSDSTCGKRHAITLKPSPLSAMWPHVCVCSCRMLPAVASWARLWQLLPLLLALQVCFT